MAMKKGENHSNNKERCSTGNLDDADQEARCVTDTSQLFHPFEGAQMFKKSTVFILHFTPACVLLSVCSLHFTLSLHFTPGPQSAVCSPQSAFYTDRRKNLLKVHIIGKRCNVLLQGSSHVMFLLMFIQFVSRQKSEKSLDIHLYV